MEPIICSPHLHRSALPPAMMDAQTNQPVPPEILNNLRGDMEEVVAFLDTVRVEAAVEAADSNKRSLLSAFSQVSNIISIIPTPVN
jgi:hypothetical protein